MCLQFHPHEPSDPHLFRRYEDASPFRLVHQSQAKKKRQENLHRIGLYDKIVTIKEEWFVVAIIVSIIAAVIALWAAYESHRANARADAANQLTKKSNYYAAESNAISSQALELAERLAPTPLSELTNVDKNTWTFRNESGRPIEILSITTVPTDEQKPYREKIFASVPGLQRPLLLYNNRLDSQNRGTND